MAGFTGSSSSSSSSTTFLDAFLAGFTGSSSSSGICTVGSSGEYSSSSRPSASSSSNIGLPSQFTARRRVCWMTLRLRPFSYSPSMNSESHISSVGLSQKNSRVSDSASGMLTSVTSPSSSSSKGGSMV